MRKGHERQKSKSLRNLPLAPVMSQRQPTNEAETNPSTPSTPAQQIPSTTIPGDEIANELQNMTLKQKEPPMNCKFHSGSIRQRVRLHLSQVQIQTPPQTLQTNRVRNGPAAATPSKDPPAKHPNSTPQRPTSPTSSSQTGASSLHPSNPHPHPLVSPQ